MSSVTYLKKMTPTRVKAKENLGVNIDRLLNHSAARIMPPQPLYADLTNLPESRGEAAHRLLDLTNSIKDPDLLTAILRLPPEQAFQAISKLRGPAPNANDPTNATTAAIVPPPVTPPAPVAAK